MGLLARRNLLAEVENADYRARVGSAEAELALREAELRGTVNGSRAEERREAEAAMQAGRAILETMVELKAGERLPLGLRVDSFIAIGD